MGLAKTERAVTDAVLAKRTQSALAHSFWRNEPNAAYQTLAVANFGETNPIAQSVRQRAGGRAQIVAKRTQPSDADSAPPYWPTNPNSRAALGRRPQARADFGRTNPTSSFWPNEPNQGSGPPSELWRTGAPRQRFERPSANAGLAGFTRPVREAFNGSARTCAYSQ
jgi:hypothetical protein